MAQCNKRRLGGGERDPSCEFNTAGFCIYHGGRSQLDLEAGR